MFAASKTSRAGSNDPFFDNVTLLLNTSGTNGAQNNTFIDSSTNNFTITRNGNATQGSINPFGEGWSNFFATSALVRFPYTSSLTSWWTQNFTMEMWIFNNTNALSSLGLPLQFAHGIYNGTPTYWAFGTNNLGQLDFYYFNGNSVRVTSTTAATLGTWNHIAMVYTHSSGNISLYLNGVSVASGTKSGTPQNDPTNTVNIGAVQSTYYNGYISNLRVLNGTALYTSTFTPSTTPLTAITNTQLLTCQSSRFVDNSANNATPTIIGAPSVQRLSPFAGTTLPTPYYSGRFDGSGDYLTFPNNSGMPFGTGAFTIEFWIYGPLNQDKFILGGRSSIGTMHITTGGAETGITAGALRYVGSSTIATGTTLITDNQWHHCAIVRNGSSAVTLYVDGISRATGTDSTNYTGTTGTWVIGTNDFDFPANAGNNQLNAYLSNLRIVKGTAVYTANFTPSTVPLQPIAGTSLLTCQSNTFVDNSTNNFAITVAGDTRPTTFAPFAVTYSSLQPYTPAVNGGSMYFDGSGDYLSNLNNNAALAMGAGDFTIESWIYSTSASTQLIYENRNNTTTTVGGLQIFRNDSIIGIFDTGAAVTLASAPIAVNTWTHVAFVRSGSSTGNMKLYLNGSLAATSASANTTNYSLGYLIIGCYLLGGTPSTFFVGYISNFRMVKGTALYTSNFVPQNTPLTAVTNTSLLLNGTNAGIYDAAVQDNFESFGNAQVNTSVKNYGTSSIAFDGAGDFLLAPTEPQLNLGARDFTIETWVNFNALVSTRMLVSRWRSAVSGSWQLFWRSTGTSMAFTIGATVLVQDPNGSRITTGTWNYIAVTRSGTTVRLFVNGVVVATGTSSVSLDSTVPLSIGIQIDDAVGPLNGYMQDVRITRGIARYTANFTPPAAPLPTF
jgi:hypothetical protein